MYQRILVPVDGSPTSNRGLREAVNLAAAHAARLVLLHVVDDYTELGDLVTVKSYDELMSGLRQRGEAILADAKAVADAAGVDTTLLLRTATQLPIAEMIVDEARKAGCELVVMGTHGRRGFRRWTLGSEAEAVARTSAVPVLLVRDYGVAPAETPPAAAAR